MTTQHTTGDGSAAATTGYGSAATTTGDGSAAATTGYGSAATTTGDCSAAATTGDCSAAATTGFRSAAATTGVRSHAFAALGAASSAHAVAVGRWVRLLPDSCDALVLPDDASVHHPMLISKDDGWCVGRWVTMTAGMVEEHPDMLLPNDGRGYTLRYTAGRYTAGCRSFTDAEALAHWSDPDHQAPASAALLLAAVKAHIAGEFDGYFA